MSSMSNATEREMKNLIRLASRTFYPHQCVLILDALLFHSVVFEEDLLKLTCMHRKVFRSFCNRLLEDRLMVAFTQKEEANQFRMISKTYYFIHWIEAIDAIKWKIHSIVKIVKDEIGQYNDPQGYSCPTCHTRYSLLDAASLLSEDKMNFECAVCSDKLVEDDSGLEAQKGQEKLEKLMTQLEPIIESLKRIDGMRIEDNNFESSLIKSIPATSSSAASYTVSNRTSKSNRNKEKNGMSQSLQNAARRSQATVHVNITANDENEALEKELQEQRNEKMQQNALPSWHMESTVGKASLGRLDQDEDEELQIQVKEEGVDGISSSEGVTVKSENGEAKTEGDYNEANTEVKEEITDADAKTSEDAVSALSSRYTSAGLPASSNSESSEEIDALTAYYAQLRARQAQEEEEEEEEEDEEIDDLDEDDIDEDAFNDDMGDEVDTSFKTEQIVEEDGNSSTPATTDAASTTVTSSGADFNDFDIDEIDEDMFEDIESDAE